MRVFIFVAILIFVSGLTGVCGAQNTASKTKAAQTLKGLEAKQKAAKAAYLKKPKDAKLKAAYVTTTNDFAYKTMMSPALGPKVKYPAALRLYRETLKVDPKNEDASKWKAEIEAIYKSMGKPIPH